MIIGKLWHTLMAQINKLANVFWTADPIAQMQYEYDLAVAQLKEGREGLEQYRALVERVGRQAAADRGHVRSLEAKVKAYLQAGDRESAARFALELQKARQGLAENEEQLKMHEQAYDNNLSKIRHASGKLAKVKEKIARYELEFAINACRAMGVPKAFLPLHRGSDGFMSIKHFETFYWPQLKSMLETLVDNGITPVVFYEGCWDQRLEHLAQLPKAKTVGYFQASDIFKVKEVLGDTMCIAGGMPNSLLAAGPVEEIRAHTKKLCEVVGRNGGFIMSTAVGEMAGSNPEFVKAWADATREYGTY